MPDHVPADVAALVGPVDRVGLFGQLLHPVLAKIAQTGFPRHRDGLHRMRLRDADERYLIR